MPDHLPSWRWLFLPALFVSFQIWAALPFASGPFSADGRYFVLDTSAALVANDTDSIMDVYRYDRQSRVFALVSVNRDNTGGGNGDSYSPVISADGSVVAFSSFASNLAPADANDVSDVFVRDLTTGVTTLISVNRSGSDGGNDGSFNPTLSADGRDVVFWSHATNLTAIPDANGGSSDIFARDRVTGVTTLVSANQAGTASGNGFSFGEQLSADGRVVVFSSHANDLVAIDGNGMADVFARDLAAGVTTLVSVNLAGTGSGNAVSRSPTVSADSTMVAFESAATDLVPNDNNGTIDVYVRDLATGVTRLASANLNGSGSGNGRSGGGSGTPFPGPRLSADGRRVVFTSLASDLVANDGNTSADVFVRDLNSSSTLLVSRNLAGTGSGNRSSFSGTLSADGTLVAFLSRAFDLTSDPVGSPGRYANLFVADLTTGEMRLASINQFGIGRGTETDDVEFYPAPILSAHGVVVAIETTANDLIGTRLGRWDLLSLDQPVIPRLNVVNLTNQLRMGWRTNATGFVLEETPTLVSPTWQSVNQAPVLMGDSYFVTLTPSATNAYFRLKK